MKKIRVIQFGLGAMGSMMVKMLLEKRDVELVAAIVHNKEDVGKDVGDLLKLGKKTGVKAYDDLSQVCKKFKPDIMLHAAASYVPDVWKHIAPAVRSGVSVITIAEEMGYPFKKYPKLSKQIDKLAKKHDATVLGTGINPGFAMDALPLLITGICRDVQRIKVTRVIDFSPFGKAIQKNIGIGLSVEEFERGVKYGKLPLHIGLPECIHMLADALGWKLDKIRETREPVIAERPIEVPEYATIEPGKVAGFNHRAYGIRKGEEIITLEELGRVDPTINYQNTIFIEGFPNITETMNVPPGNITTSSHAVNMIPIVMRAPAGLISMKDLPIAPVLVNK
jgi:4-hydroxy-tetrahydrodipicolinate reductase